MPTAAEVSAHNSSESAWTVIRGNVYDITEYAQEHPGGSKLLLREAGKDATKAFESNHAPSILEQLPESANRGPLVGSNASLLSHRSPRDQRQAAIDAADYEKIREAKKRQPRLRSILNLEDFEKVFRTGVIPTAAAEFFAGGAEDEATLLANRLAFKRYWFNARVLRRVDAVDPSTTILGNCKLAMPLICSGVGNTFQSGNNQIDICLTRALGKMGIAHMVSTFATTPLPQLAKQKTNPKQVHFFQLYVNKDHDAAVALIRKNIQAGAKAIFVTVDVPQIGNRERDRRLHDRADAPVNWSEEESSWVDEESKNAVDPDGLEASGGRGSQAAAVSSSDRDLNWDDFVWLQEAAGTVPIVIKGIQSVEDACIAAEKGVKAIVLSNHGARQLDYARAPMDVLWDLRQQRPDVFSKLEV